MTLFDLKDLQPFFCIFFMQYSYFSGGVDDLVAQNGGGDDEDEDNMSRSWQGR